MMGMDLRIPFLLGATIKVMLSLMIFFASDIKTVLKENKYYGFKLAEIFTCESHFRDKN